MANRPKRRPEKDAILFAELARHGLIGAACAAAGYKRRTVGEWRAADPEFAAEFEAALEVHVEALEAEADRRGRHGIEKPVFYQGRRIDTIREYSDTLLIFRLKALDPKYRDTQRHELTGRDGGPIETETKGDFEVARRLALLLERAGRGGA
ncbi:MAG: hypothetical protein RBS99_12080 [Rhodospirillales bacterium]|jgi:hypothetical protein|nr:hypothetical protein [Rhodospirillales bacterium]